LTNVAPIEDVAAQLVEGVKPEDDQLYGSKHDEDCTATGGG